MIVLDTHTWLWWTTGATALSRNALAAIRDADFIGVSCVSCWEIALLTAAARLTLNRDPLTWMRDSIRKDRVILLELTPEVAVEAAGLKWSHRDPADRLIVATAIVHDAPVVSKDGWIREFLNDRAIW